MLKGTAIRILFGDQHLEIKLCRQPWITIDPWTEMGILTQGALG